MKSFQEAGISLKNVIASNSSLNLEVNIDNSKKICTFCSLLETTTMKKMEEHQDISQNALIVQTHFAPNMEDQECYV